MRISLHNRLIISGIAFILVIILWILRPKKNIYERFEEKTCIVYKLHERHGFFADFQYFIETYIRAKRSGNDFYVDSSNWSYTINIGWHDYFKTLTEISDEIRSNYTNIIVKSQFDNSIKDIDGDQPIYIRDCHVALHEILKFDDSIIKRANQLKNEYGEYEALFIRKGDKITSNESPEVQTKGIIDQISLNPTMSLFIQTDDFREIESVRSLLPNKQIFYTVNESRRGDVERDRLNMSYEDRKPIIMDFFTGFYMCTQSNHCWVDVGSNVARFIKLYSPETVSFYKLCDEKIHFDLNRRLVHHLLASYLVDGSTTLCSNGPPF